MRSRNQHLHDRDVLSATGPILPDHPGVTALFAVKLVLESAYDARYDGITAGGDGDESSPRLRADLHAELDMSSPPPLC